MGRSEPCSRAAYRPIDNVRKRLERLARRELRCTSKQSFEFVRSSQTEHDASNPYFFQHEFARVDGDLSSVANYYNSTARSDDLQILMKLKQ
jgi:hypothetical protein